MNIKRSTLSGGGLCFLQLFLLIMIAAGCASIGNPGGGPRDEDAPRFVKANPMPGSVNVTSKRIVIEFDELVNVKDAFTNVIISPVSQKIPKVTSLGHRVIIDFQEDLLPNTTYTLDFGNSIEDNNEGNKLYGFSYSFSTGEEIDSLRISGIVLGALDSEPRPGMIVGVYKNLNDTAFSRTRPDRIARTDDRGHFVVRGLSPGSYRVYAVADADADYHYANPEEEVGFLSEIIVPGSEPYVASDTIRNLKTGAIDTIVERNATRFLPNDLLIRTFKSQHKKQYIVENSRIDSTRIKLIFNSPQGNVPELRRVGAGDVKMRYAAEHSPTNDTIIYWLRGADLIGTDTLRVAVDFNTAGPGEEAVIETDTLRLITPRQFVKPTAQRKKKNKNDDGIEEEVKTPLLGLTFSNSGRHDVNMPLVVEFETPIVSLNKDAFHLSMKEEGDSVWKPVLSSPEVSLADSSSLRKFRVDYPWAYDTGYKLEIDSLAATGIYGLSSGPQSKDFRTKSEEDYCSLRLNIVNFTEGIPAFVELLNGSDVAVKRKPVENGHVVFDYVNPGTYYLRIYEDNNGDGIYTAGEFVLDRQPDMAYYYPKSIKLRKNWDQEETWSVFDTAIDLMKPNKIKKNKPEADKRKATTEEPEEEDLDEMFDPLANPFDPNQKNKRKSARGF